MHDPVGTDVAVQFAGATVAAGSGLRGGLESGAECATGVIEGQEVYFRSDHKILRLSCGLCAFFV